MGCRMTRVRIQAAPAFLRQLLSRSGSSGSPLIVLILMMFPLSTMSARAMDALPPYPNASVEISEKQQHQNHPVITNLMKKVNGVVISDGAKWLMGELDRTLYQLPTGQTSSQGFEYFVQEFEKQGVEVRFQCRSFSCGASNFWANNVFDIARLYGQDRHQAYYIGQKQGRFYSVYSVRRGNGRVYTLVDVFSPENASIRSIGTDFLKEGYGSFFLQGRITSEDPQFLALQEQLIKQPSFNILLVINGRVEGLVGDWERQYRELEKKAEVIRKQLLANGVDNGRFRVHINAISARNWPDKASDNTLWLEAIVLK